MKKLWILPVIMLLLCGCGAQETFETISDVYAVPASTIVYELSFSLPEDALVQTVAAQDGSKLYLCDGYSVTAQTFPSGDLDRTLRSVSGFGKDSIYYIQTRKDGHKCYSFAWSAAGETGENVCRGVILDDGTTHHALTVMADHTKAGALDAQWQHILKSATLISTG